MNNMSFTLKSDHDFLPSQEDRSLKGKKIFFFSFPGMIDYRQGMMLLLDILIRF